jgi:tRNA-splicing ligase RtcB
MGHIARENFKKINDWLWEVEKTGKMNVPARIYVSEKMLDGVFKDRSIGQLINTASLPGIINYSMAMPDIHEGYGFPIGGVAAMDKESGVISPGGVGYDINCGMKLLKSEFLEKDIKPYLENLATEIQKEVPSGLGQGRQMKIDIPTLDKILEGGAKRLVEQGYGEREDVENCEANGRLDWADAETVSNQAKNRGRDQVDSKSAP